MSAVAKDPALVQAEQLDEVMGGASRESSVKINGELVTVRPMSLRMLRAFLPHARPLVEWLGGTMQAAASLKRVEDLFKSTDLIDLMDKYGDSLVRAAAAAIEREPEFVEGATPDEVLALVAKVVAVNLDFFVHRLIPTAGDAAHGLATELVRLRGVGRIASKS